MKLRKGQLLEEMGAKSESVYRLVKGRVEMRSGGDSIPLLLNAPVTIFAANVFFGHGEIVNSFSAAR